ncbi:glycosyltransferase [Bacteroides fragilis]
MGGMANEDVINFMKTIDILVLPTYYKAEAFPISILEAMSLGKIVISTERAAIKDMLTGKNGNNCGLFVKEKSVDDIVDKIKYCIENHNEAELLMKMHIIKFGNHIEKKSCMIFIDFIILH